MKKGAGGSVQGAGRNQEQRHGVTKEKNLILSVFLTFLFYGACSASETPMCTLSKPKVQKEKNITIYEYEVTCASAIKMESLSGKLDIEKTAASFQVMKDCFKSQKKTGCFKDKIDIEAEIKILNTSDWAKVKAKKFNSLVGATGYRFEAESGEPDWDAELNLYKGNKLILSNLELHHFAVNPSKTRFVFRDGDSIYLLSKNNIKKFLKKDTLKGHVLGVYEIPWLLSDNIVSFEGVRGTEKYGKVIYFKEYVVKFNGKVVYHYNMQEERVKNGGKGWLSYRPFYVINNHWVLKREPDIDVIIDGVSLAQKYGYKKVFQYEYLKGKPFYFFSVSPPKIKINYGGSVLKLEFDDIPHDSKINYTENISPRVTDNSIRFFARRGNKMLYVEIK